MDLFPRGVRKDFSAQPWQVLGAGGGVLDGSGVCVREEAWLIKATSPGLPPMPTTRTRQQGLPLKWLCGGKGSLVRADSHVCQWLSPHLC